MATGTTYSYNDSEFLFRLQTLIIDGGTTVLQNIFDQQLGNVPLNVFLANEKTKINRLRGQKIITTSQYDQLYPQGGQLPNITDFDITLITCLLRNLPSLGLNTHYRWNYQPQPTDLSTEADLTRLRGFRNEIAHIKSTAGVDKRTFQTKWNDIEQVLLRLNNGPKPVSNFQQTIDIYKNSSLDPAEERRVKTKFEEWRELEKALESEINLVKEDMKTAKGEMTQVKEDVKGVKSDNKDVRSDVDKVGQDMKTVKCEITLVKKEIKSVKNDNEGVGKAIKTVTDEITMVKEEIKSVKNDNEGVGKDIKTVTDEITLVKEEIKSVKNDNEGVGKDMKTVTDEITLVKEEVKSVKNDSEGVGKDIKTMKEEITLVKEHVKGVKSAFDEVESKVNRFEEDVQGLNRQAGTDVSCKQREEVKPSFFGSFLSRFKKRRVLKRLGTADQEEEPHGFSANEPLRPSLTDPEIFADPYTLKEYEKAIIEGQERDRTIRLMIIGCYDQGKTTLARRLLYQPLEGTESTNGIDIHRVACKQDGKVWDRIEHEDINREKIERLAVLPDVRHVVSNTDQEQYKIIYSRIPVADETEIIKSENLMETDNKNRPTLSLTVSPRKHSDLILYKKFREELQTTEQDNKLALQLWDFGGQFVFYSTHQLFHARNAIYLLVFNLTRELDFLVIDKDYPGGARPFVKSMRDYITFWITSVHSFVGTRDSSQPKIVLVGTHKDELNNENEAEEYFKEVKKMFAKSKLRHHIYPKCFAISGKDLTDDTVTSIRETVMEIGKLNRQIIPARWLPLEMELRAKEKENILTYEKVNEINHSLEYSQLSEAQMKAFLKFHHFRGTFIYFDEGEMAKHVVVNPPFIVNAFRCIITSGEFCNSNETLDQLWQKLTESAILEPELIQAAWELCPDLQFIKFKDVLVSLLKRHRIIAEAQKFNEESEELESLNFYLVPSFLRKPTSSEIQEFMKGRTCTKVSIVYVFDNEAIVQTIFQRITCAAIGSWPVISFRENQLLFENAGVYELNNINYAGIILHTGNKIEIAVAQMCTGKAISAKFPDYLRRLVEYVMKKEFRKLLVDDRYLIDDTPYSTSLRCMDEYHYCKGSKKIYDLGMLKSQKERDVCCPDKEAHGCINVKDALQEWFDYKVCYKDVPQRRLDERIDATQFTKLSIAFGDQWESLGRLLGLSEVKIQHVKMDNQNTAMRIYDMLMKWENEIQEEATTGKLLTAIEKLPKQSVDWDIVKNLIDKID